jgi:rubrerythrin
MFPNETRKSLRDDERMASRQYKEYSRASTKPLDKIKFWKMSHDEKRHNRWLSKMTIPKERKQKSKSFFKWFFGMD